MNDGDVQAQQRAQLRDWARLMDEVRRLLAESLPSDAGYDLVFNGIAPDGTVD